MPFTVPVASASRRVGSCGAPTSRRRTAWRCRCCRGSGCRSRTATRSSACPSSRRGGLRGPRELFDATGRPFEPELADEAARAFAELGASQREEVLVHRDLHGGNVLSAEREPWLIIDPKPTAGERAFDAAWLLGDRQRIVTPALARRRLDETVDALGLDRERLRRWTIAR